MILALLLALFVPSIAFGAACSGSGLAWTCPAGSTIAEVNTAMGSATDGAVITFAAGAYTWTVGSVILHNAKGTSLVCESVGGCTVTISNNSVVYMDDLTGDNTKTYRVSGFTFTGGNGCLCIFLASSGVGSMRNLRIDHNTFDSFTVGTIAVFLGAQGQTGKFTGVLDHNTFTGPDNFMALKVLGPGDPSHYSASVRGTADNMFVEDNVFTFTNWTDTGSPNVDAWLGAAVVIRYNTSTNNNTGPHGVTHGGVTNWETYGNALIRTAGSGPWTDGTRLLRHQGSGEWMAWGNRFTVVGTINDAIDLVHYRDATPGETGDSIAQCDGTQGIDGNLTPLSTYRGYPCWFQPGRGPNAGTPSYGSLMPLYIWGNINTADNAKVDLTYGCPWSIAPFYCTEHIVANRDYYNAVSANAQTSASSPFDGTTGMGFGTLANRPTTCTHTTAPDGDEGGGVAYWATDQGTWNQSTSNPHGVQQNGADGVLYRCSATNTWTVHYTPYTYPHPLQGFVAAEVTGAGIKGSKGLGLF